MALHTQREGTSCQPDTFEHPHSLHVALHTDHDITMSLYQSQEFPFESHGGISLRTKIKDKSSDKQVIYIYIYIYIVVM